MEAVVVSTTATKWSAFGLTKSKFGQKKGGSEPIWFEWLALAGMLLFGAWLLGTKGVWALLLSSDPTGITAVIIILFLAATIWSGSRALELSKQHDLLSKSAAEPMSSNSHGWAAQYWQHLKIGIGASDTALDILMSKTHGPHTTAWWVNAIQLKLGLLGKVIGFSILALNIGQLQSFDPNQSQELLKSLTSGLGVALLTTMVGLVGNILLGLQLTRLDRYADDLIEQAQTIGLQVLAKQGVV
jgi:MotA/TolQ/ExbB proton channel family